MLINTIHAGRGYSTCRSLSSVPSLTTSTRLLRLFSQVTSFAKGSLPRKSPGLSALTDLLSRSEELPSFVFRSNSSNPYHNLAIEDYLLRNSAHTSHILFFYTNRPCVVIGRNQNPWLECNLRLIQQGLPAADQDPEGNKVKDEGDNSIPIDLVRRRSGGGTVFHDEGNLNYSVIVPNDTNFRRAKHAQMVVRALQGAEELDFNAKVKVNERNDIVMQRKGESEWLKISGSAFKLIRGRALHHGTLLYSSPYLKDISEVLRSPGRNLIRAKGVESVRSKVGNLHWTEDLEERGELKEIIMRAIMHEFRGMYGEGVETMEVGEDDVHAEGNIKIAKGVDEMMANEWRFEQTPKFDFNSDIKGQGHDRNQVFFHANRGLLEQLGSRDGRGSENVFDSPGVHLHTVRDWGKVLEEVMGQEALSAPWDNEALMQQLATVFPPWSNTLCASNV